MFADKVLHEASKTSCRPEVTLQATSGSLMQMQHKRVSGTDILYIGPTLSHRVDECTSEEPSREPKSSTHGDVTEKRMSVIASVNF